MKATNFFNLLNPSAPKGIIPDAKTWVLDETRKSCEILNPQPKSYYRTISEPEENIVRLPRGTKNYEHEEFENVRWSLSRESGLFYSQNCRVLGSEAAVISSDNRVFAEFTYPPSDNWSNHSAFKRRRIPKVTALKGWYATITYPASQHYFHWMFESLPRLRLLQGYLDVLDGIFVPENLQDFHYESLSGLGVGKERLIPVNTSTHYQPEHLFVPKFIAMYNPPTWFSRWYQESYLSGTDTASGLRRKIYISRDDARARKLENENAVVSSLVSKGFEKILLSNMSFKAQARLFHSAEVIVAPHGAGLSNLVFCKPGTKVLEIFPPKWMAPCFMAIAVSARLDYDYVVAEEVGSRVGESAQTKNIVVDLECLLSCLNDLTSE